MQKTTVYLPDELKRELSRVAVETRRSEAEIIRDAIRRVIEESTPPTPHTGIFVSGDAGFADRIDELLEGFGEH